MMDDGRSLAVTLLMVNDVPANQEIFEPLARKRRDCDWWIHDLMIETFLSDFKEEIIHCWTIFLDSSFLHFGPTGRGMNGNRYNHC